MQVVHKIKKTAWNLPGFKLLSSIALELAVPINLQNASCDSCSISMRHKMHHSITNIMLALGMTVQFELLLLACGQLLQ